MAAERREARENRRQVLQIIMAGVHDMAARHEATLRGQTVTEVPGRDGQPDSLMYDDGMPRHVLENWGYQLAKKGTISSMTRGGRWWPGRVPQYPRDLPDWARSLLPGTMFPEELVVPLVQCSCCLTHQAANAHTCEGCGWIRYCSEKCRRVHAGWHHTVCAELRAKAEKGKATMRALWDKENRRGAVGPEDRPMWYSVDALQFIA